MPADAKAKGKAKPVRVPSEESAAELGEDDRILEVRLRATHTSDTSALPEGTLQHLLHCTFCGEETVVRLGDAVARGPGEPAGAVTAPAGELDVVLTQQRIRVDLTTLTRLLAAAEGRPNAVALYRPPVGTRPPPATAESGGAAPAAKGGAKARLKTSAPPAAIHDLTGEPLGSACLSFHDVMHVADCAYPLPLVDIPGLRDCRIVLTCRGGCLTPPVVLRRLRPVCIAVHSVDCAEDAAAAPVRVSLEVLGHSVLTPPLTSTRGAAPPLFRTIRFLGDMPPLTVYQRALLEPVRVGVQRTGAVAGVVGCGTFSLRDLVSDRQTYFSESVSLLPASRAAAAVSLGGHGNCLTAGCTVTCSLDFYVPLPPLEHVDAAGLPAPPGARMTRGVAVLPYAAPWTQAAIATLLRQLLQSRRATAASDVQLYVEPSPPPSPVEAGEGDGGAGGAAEAPGAHRSAAQGPSTVKPDASGRPPPAQAPGAAPAAPAASAGAGGGGGAGSGAGEAEAARTERVVVWPLAEASVRVVSPEGISGFEVADGERRVVCIEGPAGEVYRILSTLSAAATAAGAPPGAVRLLMNPEYFAARRLYLSYPPLVTPPTGRALARGPEPAGPAGSDDEAAAVDEMGGGCGGRLHRLRLREPLAALTAQQSLLLRRTLSESCLRCILQLDSLTRCSTLREAALRSLFPSAADLISLERAFGQTLELPDIFGSDTFEMLDTAPALPPARGEGGRAGAGAVAERERDEDVFDLAAALRLPAARAVGRLVSFEGTPLCGRRGRTVTAAVTARYPRVLWMLSREGVEVLCAFPGEVPTGTVRYHVEGQVVEVAGTRLLYALACRTLAKSFTSSRNVPYTQALAARRRAENQRRLARSRLRAEADAAPAALDAPCAMASRRPPSGGTGSPTMAVSRGRGGDSSSDDDNDAACPPRDHGLDGAAAPYEMAASRAGVGLVVGGTKTSRIRAAAARTAREAEPVVDYEALWEIYEKRAPKNGARA